MTAHWSDALVEVRACAGAVRWARTQPSMAAAWSTCRRGDWMLWYAGQRGVRRQDLVLAACACARLSLPYAKGDAAELAIVTTEQWAHGDPTATLDDVRDAASAAYAATGAADAASHVAAANYAAYAANAANAANYAAYAANADREKVLAQCADIVRRFWEVAP